MSYFRRGYNWEQIQYLPAPTGGWNPDVPWHELPSNQAAQLDNFLIKPGRISMRGAFTVMQDLSAFQPLNARGWVSGDSAPSVQAVQALCRTGANVAGIGSESWSNPGNITAEDGNSASATFGGFGTSRYLQASNFGFSIPAGATITGISVAIRHADFTGIGVQDNRVQLMKASVIQATDRADTVNSWPPSLSYKFYGGTYTASTDMWGNTWTPAEINNAGFGVSLSATLDLAAATANVDDIVVFVFYVPAGGFTAASNSQWILLGRKAIGSANTVDHWDVPLVRPTASAILGVGTGTGVWLTQTANTARAGLSPTPGPRWINFDGLLYGLSYDDLGTGGTASDVNSNYVTWKTKLLTLPLSQTAAAVPTILTNAPQGAYDLKVYESSIFLLGGVDIPGGLTTHSTTDLFFTNPGVSGVGTASADWKDPVTGLVNKIRLDSNTHDFGVGFGTVRNGLLIFRRNSIYILRGTTPANFTTSQVSKEHGCIDARSIVETDQGVYFLSRDGLMLTDGVSVKNVSGSCELTIQQAIGVEQAQVLAMIGGYASCGLTPDGNLLVSIGTYQTLIGIPTGKIQPIWSAVYDRRTGTWTRITSALWASDGLQVAGNLYPGPLLSRPSPQLLFALGDQYVTNLAGLAQDAPTALYDQLPSGASPFVAIPAVWKSRPALVVGDTTLTRKFGQAKRFFCDYVLEAPDILAATGFSVVAVDAADNTYAAVLGVPINTAAFAQSGVSVSPPTTLPAPTPRVQRLSSDFTNETSDLAFDVTWTDTARAASPARLLADLYGIGIEYQPARDAR